MHGGSGLLDGDVDLRVFTSKWLGDDVVVNFQAHGMDPDHSEIMTQYGLKPGDRPGTDLYPKIWSNPQVLGGRPTDDPAARLATLRL
jgi:hypothetical protein